MEEGCRQACTRAIGKERSTKKKKNRKSRSSVNALRRSGVRWHRPEYSGKSLEQKSKGTEAIGLQVQREKTKV